MTTIMPTTNQPHLDAAVVSRAQGCLLGQLAGDALGSLVEFRTAESIRHEYQNGARELVNGGTWNTIAGQITDDGELALALARTLVRTGRYDAEQTRRAYVYWLDSNPFDCGMTVSSGLRGEPNSDSQANGALMRVSPLGIFGATHDLHDVAEWAKQDAALTHPNPICLEANALFAMAIAHAVRTGCGPNELYSQICRWADEMNVQEPLREAIHAACTNRPSDYNTPLSGWVLVAFQNALFQLLHAPTLEDGVVDTVNCGGDTDTNGCIAGALLGAVYGRDAVPERWMNTILNCRPEAGNPDVRHPRPRCFWPVDALELAEELVSKTD
jgi:ADP-ribosylglycohydrolase